MSARRRRREEPEEHVNHERWLVSYSDMMTVLMALFLVLYAIGQVDVGKFEALKSSLARGFGHTGDVVLVGGTGVMDASSDLVGVPDVGSTLTGLGDQVADGEHTPAEVAAARAELADLSALRDEVAGALGESGHAGAVEFRVTDAGLVIGMVTTDVFFAPGSDAIEGEFREVVDAIGGPLARSPYEVKIEGHADIVPVGSRFETNWDLSAARATAVLRRLVEHREVDAERISAVGYGEARPLVEGTDPAALAANRRVDIVVLSAQPERVRELLPIIENSSEGPDMAVVEQRVVGAPRQKIGAGRGAAPTPEPEPEEKPAGGRSWLKVAALVVAVSLVVAMLTFYLVVVRPEAAARKAAEPPVPGAIVQLEPMNLNLASGRYLRLGLGLQLTEDAGSEFDVTRAKDAVITLLSGRAVDDVTSPEGREAVRAALEEELAVAYSGAVLGVYFTDFVTQ